MKHFNVDIAHSTMDASVMESAGLKFRCYARDLLYMFYRKWISVLIITVEKYNPSSSGFPHYISQNFAICWF